VYREKVGGVWQPPLVLDSVGPDSGIALPYLAAGPDNRVHVVYLLQGGGISRYIYRCRNGTVWSPRELIHAGADTFPTSEVPYWLRVNPFTGESHIIFYQSGGSYHSWRSNGIWQPRETLYITGGDTIGGCDNFTFTRNGIGYGIFFMGILTRHVVYYWYRERNRNGEWGQRYLVRPGDSLHRYYFSGFTSGGDGPNPDHLYFIWNMTGANSGDTFQIYFKHGAPGPQGRSWKERVQSGFTALKVSPRGECEFNLKRVGFVRLGVYDVMGRQERLLVAGYKEPGRYMVKLPDDIACGVHFIQLEVPDTRVVKKVVLVR
jgi:hypothetical protein